MHFVNPIILEKYGKKEIAELTFFDNEQKFLMKKFVN